VRGFTDGGGCFPTGLPYPGLAGLIRVHVAGLVAEHDPETSFVELPIVSIDTETTGRNVDTDRIVEVACVFWRGGEIAGEKSWLVNPMRPIPQEAFDVHGISDDLVRDQPEFGAVASEILAAFGDCVPLAYNAEFDRRFVFAEMELAGKLGGDLPPPVRRKTEWIDPLVWAREIHAHERSRSLGDVCERLGIQLTQAHRATFDAEAALRVMMAFAKDRRVPHTYGAFVRQQREYARQQDERARFWRR
jgi:DNA polymerase-3 subunit epsilon